MKYLFEEPYDYQDKDAREQAERAFLDRYDAYLSEFAVAEPLLPKRFVKEYKKDYFHDYNVKELVMFPDKKGLCLNLTLKNYELDELLICYRNVRSLKTDIDGDSWSLKVFGMELLPAGEKAMSQEFSFLREDASLSFTFSSLRFQKTKHS